MGESERVRLFQEMILYCHSLYVWKYDKELEKGESSCPDAEAASALFGLQDRKRLLSAFSDGERMPVVVSGNGVSWIAVPASGDAGFYVLGPARTHEGGTEGLDAALSKLPSSASLRKSVRRFFQALPVISISRFYEYGIMLYGCVTGEQARVSDFRYQDGEESPRQGEQTAQVRDVHGTYELEREMQRLVREGDLSIQSHMGRLAVSGQMGVMAKEGSLRQFKNAVLVCIILFSRAAIEGGLSPETAMDLTDRYFQGVEETRTVAELEELAKTMQNDFVERVHRVRTEGLSAPVRECCDRILRSLDRNLAPGDLAQALGYSEEHLCRSFRKETGETMTHWMRKKKLEKAKMLLEVGERPIQDISESLGFCSPSYFSEKFRAEYGMTPSAVRRGRRTDGTEIRENRG